MGIIAWLILGLVAGFIASKVVNKTGSGLIMDIVLGVVGAFVGGWLYGLITHTNVMNRLDITSLVVATVGAIIVMLAFHFVVRRQST
ncbi:MAG TPA: GlsB/YeaQ/YmgE family stress response membrane protein [Caulobacteraceae bacterium]|jgi:uncharacterized membrane protein YeaQ/YmgE (transglycosylase-associated protein family)